jgi:hypothetical protein
MGNGFFVIEAGNANQYISFSNISYFFQGFWADEAQGYQSSMND